MGRRKRESMRVKGQKASLKVTLEHRLEGMTQLLGGVVGGTLGQSPVC